MSASKERSALRVLQERKKRTTDDRELEKEELMQDVFTVSAPISKGWFSASVKNCIGLTIALAVIIGMIVLFTHGQYNKRDRPLIIAHRGSPGILPEHTLEGYETAIRQGADCIECDVILTKDAVPICMHDLTLDATTNIIDKPEFKDRRTTRIVDGSETEGFFVIDFTIDEIKTLKARQRFSFRDPNYDDLYEIPTFQEQMDLVRDWDKRDQTNVKTFGKTGRSQKNICLYPEMKSSTWHNSMNIFVKRFEDVILDIVEKNGYESRSDPIYIQSFETKDLQYVSARSSIKLIQLLGEPDEIQFDTQRKYSQMMSKEGLEAISKYAFAISPSFSDIAAANNSTGTIESYSIQLGKLFVSQAHDNGLDVHPYTFRNENQFLAWNFGQDIYEAYTLFVKEIGIDGFFTDFSETAFTFLQVFMAF